jgi:hypothetical protein
MSLPQRISKTIATDGGIPDVEILLAMLSHLKQTLYNLCHSIRIQLECYIPLADKLFEAQRFSLISGFFNPRVIFCVQFILRIFSAVLGCISSCWKTDSMQRIL